ncbi:MAG: tetratricopeptide repeat protein, partial [Bacteroidia bacterium]|nr:tetratricopeptide repeat protein [Bacteroidia bacterium]
MNKDKKQIYKHGKKQEQISDLFQKGFRPFLWIAAIAFLAYLPTLWFGYSPLDDFTLIVKRLDWLKDIRHFPDIFTKGIFFAEDAKVPDYYRPLLTVTFMIDVLIGKGSPVICHLTNVLIHMAATCLCFSFLNHLIENRKLSFLFTLLFAVHPILTHAVAWIPGRNDSLMAVFIFSSAIFYLKYLKIGSIKILLLSGLMYLAALFTKENAIIFLPLVAFLDLVVTGRINIRKLIIPFFMFSILTIAWWIIRAKVVMAVPYAAQLQKPGLYLGLLAPMLIFLQKSFLPVQQSVFSNVTDTSLIPSLIVLAFLIFVIVRYGFRNKRLVWFGIAWYFLFLLIPTMHALFNGLSDIHFEHRLYIPLAGLLIAVSQVNLPYKKYFYVFLIIISAFFVKTLVRSSVYEDSYSFAIAAVNESPNLANVYNIRGNEFNNLGRFNEAIADYSHGLKL